MGIQDTSAYAGLKPLCFDSYSSEELLAVAKFCGDVADTHRSVVVFCRDDPTVRSSVAHVHSHQMEVLFRHYADLAENMARRSYFSD